LDTLKQQSLSKCSDTIKVGIKVWLHRLNPAEAG